MDILKTTLVGLVLVPVIWLTFTLTSGVILPLMILLGLASCLSLVLFSRQRRLDREMRGNQYEYVKRQLGKSIAQKPTPSVVTSVTSSGSSVPLDGPTARKRSE